VETQKLRSNDEDCKESKGPELSYRPAPGKGIKLSHLCAVAEKRNILV